MGVIGIDATAAGATGADINGIINAFNPGFSPAPPPGGTGNAGAFSPGMGARAFDQYGIQPPSGTDNALVANGDFDYSPSTNTLEGTLNSIAFGTDLKDGATSVASPAGYFTAGTLSLADPTFTISNLGLSGTGAGNNLHNTFFTLLSGSESLFNAWLFNTAGNSINFTGSIGNDTLDGNGGTDTLSYSFATSGVTVSLATTTAQTTGGSGTDTISDFENLTGSSSSDVLAGGITANVINGGDGSDNIAGGSGADTLLGGNGADNIAGENGADSINGGAAADMLSGGAGNDTFHFTTSTEANGDAISDFDGITKSGGDADIIDLRSISGLNSWGGLVSAANAVWYAVAGGNTTVYGDTSGDGSADFSITLANYTAGLTGHNSASSGYDVLV